MGVGTVWNKWRHRERTGLALQPCGEPAVESPAAFSRTPVWFLRSTWFGEARRREQEAGPTCGSPATDVLLPSPLLAPFQSCLCLSPTGRVQVETQTECPAWLAASQVPHAGKQCPPSSLTPQTRTGADPGARAVTEAGSDPGEIPVERCLLATREREEGFWSRRGLSL